MVEDTVVIDGKIHKIDWLFSDEDKRRTISTKNSFSLMFPKYREKYLRDNIEEITSFLKERTVDCSINFLKGEINISNTPDCYDPTQYFISRDFIRLICRGCDINDAKLIFEIGNISNIIPLNELARNKKMFINRRNRLFGPDGVTLKAIELITKTKCTIQGRTMLIIGKPKGVNRAKKIVEDAMNNIHPILNIKRLMVLKELENNPEMQGKDWTSYLPVLNTKSASKSKKKHKESNKKKIVTKKKSSIKDRDEFICDFPKSKIDLQLESGEYFMKKEFDNITKKTRNS